MLLVFALLIAGAARAEDAASLARIHEEAIGGRLRLGLLQTMRVEGEVLIDGRRLEFTLWAQRPNQIWMETRADDRVIIQATDGVNPPWQMDPNAEPPKPTYLPVSASLEFSADAEFDDPLVNYEAKGYTLDYAGTVDWYGRRAFKLFVTRRHFTGYYLLVDAETYFIVGKESVRNLGFGREIPIETRYDDFRPVAGIIMPHRVVVTSEGKLLHETRMRRVRANAPVPPDAFAMPGR
ncbi:MAG: hypothetical protein ACO3DQ_09000 [Cephaloticoccus sp.]